jgi:hypothetical protein
VNRTLEYLEEAFSADVDVAESIFSQLPEAGRIFDHGTRRHLLERLPSIVSRVEERRISIVAGAGRRPEYWQSRKP